MKIPKSLKRFCPYCRKHTSHKISNPRHRGLGKSHPLTRWSKKRTKLRGLRRGTGNLGRFSRPPIAQWKMTGAKQSKKTDLRFTCEVCKKIHVQRKGTRAKKVEIK